jgi:hypothetical protein
VVERSKKLRFPFEAVQPLSVLREFFGKDFDGNVAPELGVPRAIDFPHPARTNES